MFERAEAEDLAAAGDVGVKRDPPCPICGGRDYTWGTLSAQGIGHAPGDATWLARNFAVGVRLKARRCGACGNVQAFARP